MNTDSEKVKNFLLETTIIQNDRTIGSQIVYVRNCGFIFLISCLSVLFWITFNVESANIITRFVFILTILLTIITAVFTFRKHQHKVKNWIIEDDSISMPYKDKSFGGIAGGLGAVIIILLYNNTDFSNVDFSETIIMMFFITVMIFGSLFSMYGLCMFQYKLYLLKKYCLDIKDLKANDL